MVWVPAGEFYMGAADLGQTVHHVRITKGFWLSKCTVTNAQYRSYCQGAGAEFPKESDQADNHPVIGVTWIETEAYSNHYGLSLPTEAQWEYAARGPQARQYPWGNEWDPKKCCNWSNRGPGDKTFPVGSFPPGASWCGALDMAGNVFQWCQDWYSDAYYANSPDADPSGPDNGEARVQRGGSWYGDSSTCRSAGRSSNDPTYRFNDFGFRCSRTP
jgi:formylglycine-generating enzyme required for sulfatase activity